jgi:hypothetical protein
VLFSLHKPQDVIQLDRWLLDDVANSPPPLPPPTVAAPSPLASSLAERSGSFIGLGEVLSKCSRATTRAVCYTTTRQVVFAAILKSLDLLGYFTHVIPQNSAIPTETCESGLCPFAEALKQEVHDNSEFEYELIVVIELLRTNALTLQPLAMIPRNGSVSQPQRRASGNSDDLSEDSEAVLLCARIAGVLDVPIERPVPNPLPRECSSELDVGNVYDRQSCAFMIIVRSVMRTLRELLEIVTVTVFFEMQGFDSGERSSAAPLQLSEFAALPAMLPFSRPPSAVGALLLRQVLLASPDYDRQCNTAEKRIEYLQTLFPAIPNLKANLQRVLMFLSQSLRLLRRIQVADGDIVPVKIGRVLKDAQDLVQSKMLLHFPEARRLET